MGCSEFNNTYLKALHLRRLLRHQLSSLFRIPNPLTTTKTSKPTNSSSGVPQDGVDVLLHPTAIHTAPPLDEAKEEGKSEYLQDLLTVPASLAGLPAMSVPAGRGTDGWPVGVSLVGQWGMEEMVFWAGKGIESWDGNR
jgi:aspartyl-tRNA(Asn)/glutamyl-tRNA(Gln) amidotransferase subunit A